MRALITGASSGIGRDMAILLSEMGYELILVARTKERLESLSQELKTKTEIHVLDLSIAESCYALHKTVSEKGQPVDLLVNNAGVGTYGPVVSKNLDTELNLIDLNVRAVHILTKLFLLDFTARDQGTILNVSSIAAFLPGPLMSSYYASKAYVQRLSEAISEELRRQKSKVRICTLCPGPVRTGFNKRAGERFLVDGMESRAVAAYALRKTLRGKLVIIPGWPVRLLRLSARLAGTRLMLRAVYMMQFLRRP